MKRTDSIWAMSSALLALASSVLTDLLYGELSNARYEGCLIDEKITLEQINSIDFWTRLGAIGLLFFATWTILFIFRWFFPKLINRVKYRNKKNYTRSKVYGDFITVKEILIETADKVDVEPERIVLYTDKIGDAIVRLHDTFCPQKQKLKRVVKASFRTGTMTDFGQRISPYEYLATIDMANKLLRCLEAANNDIMLQSDCKGLCNQIEDLKAVLS